MQAYHLIAAAAQGLRRPGRADRRGEHHPRRALGPGYLAGRAGGRPGRDAVINHEVVRGSWIAPEEIAGVERRERQELERQARRFRAGRPRVDITGRTAVLVDDGVATGSTARAACEVARAQGAGRVMFAAPVGAPRSAQALVGRRSCDEVILLRTPASFRSVGQWYADFTPVPDAEVTALLQGTARSA